MKRFIIKHNKTGEYMRRASGSYSWVKSADDATLLTTASAASRVAARFCEGRYYRWHSGNEVTVIEATVILIPDNSQPFFPSAK